MIGLLISNNKTTLYENITEQDMFELYMSEIEDLFDTEIYTVEAAVLNNLNLPKYYDWWIGKSILDIKEIIAESVQVELFTPFTLPSGPNEHNKRYYYNDSLNICTDENSVIDSILYHDDYAYTTKEKEAIRKLLRENKEMRGWRACKLQIPMNYCG